MSSETNSVLTRLRAALDETYGLRLERAVLYGSRARGDAQPDSDYDVAVFLRDLRTFSHETGALADIETDILFETGAVINALPFPAGSHRESTALMSEIRRDGRDL